MDTGKKKSMAAVICIFLIFVITKILSRYNLKIGSLSYEGLLPLDGKVIKEIWWCCLRMG